MGFRLTTKDTLYCNSREEVLTQAERLQALQGLDNERVLKHHRMTRIKERLLGGEARPFVWAVGRVPALGLACRVNGQHSSCLFLQLTEEEWAQVRYPIVVEWEEYQCDSAQDLSILFETFDASWSSRSNQDVAGFHMAQHAHLKPLSRKLGEKLVAGLAWYDVEVQGRLKRPGMQFAFFHRNHRVQTFLVWAGGVLHPTRTRELLMRPAVGAMFHSLQGQDAEQSRQFWKDVARGYEALPEGSIPHKLSWFLEALHTPLCAWPAAVTRQFRSRQRRPSGKDVFASCLRAVARANQQATLSEVFCSAKALSASEIASLHYPVIDVPAEE